MTFQTPTLALALPQTRPRGLNSASLAAKEYASLRRRRVIAGVVLAALCLCVVLFFLCLFIRLPTYEVFAQPSLHNTLFPEMEQQQVLRRKTIWPTNANTISRNV
ncbi:unnamed protein product [Peronospora destructor]|uniref:Uncharacterized protein n=1 Tax=Peronospora destructor TaxID=86335 RepID=A0AAV0U036_9STRA|nr:unnamed protein product [Peronospora destructor]